MNETIGVKGGKNDRRRTIKIKEAKKKKIQEQDEELKQLEKEVGKQQVFTLIKALPIAVVGGAFKTMYDTAVGVKKIDKENANSNWRIKEYDTDNTTLQHGEDSNGKKVVVNSNGEKVVVSIDEKKSILDDILIVPKSKIVKSDGLSTDTNNIEELDDNKKEDKNNIDIKESPITNNSSSNNIVGVNSDYDNLIDSINIYTGDNLSEASKETLQKLKAKKILSEYDRQLKDVRYELRKLIFDYNVLADASNEVVLSEDAQIILDKLSDIINRIEILKDKIKITDLDKYDDNYIYTLVEGYLAEFKDQKLVKEIKDSPLYILISQKLDEIDSKKDDLNKKVDEKKEKLEEKEEKFDKLKEKYYNVERFSKEIIEFQKEQEALLRSIQEKVRNATSIEEKVKVEVEVMNRQSIRALRLLTLQMMLPGARMAAGITATTASYLYFIRNIARPKTVTNKYKVISVIDYSDEINNNIDLLDDAKGNLGKTSSQIEKMIKMINEEYSDYFDVVPECEELLNNLKRIKSNIDEKEYEMEKIKEQQLLLLEQNNKKVKARGEYKM